MNRTFLPFLLTFLFACGQKDRRHAQAQTNSRPAAQSATSVPANSEAQPADSFALHVPPPDPSSGFAALSESRVQHFRIPAGIAGYSLRGRGGTQIDFVAEDLETLDGRAVRGPVEVELIECFNPYEMLLAGAPTCSDGRLLASGGSYFIGMKSEGSELRLREGRSLQVRFPRRADGPMDLFYGERGADGLVNWRPAGIAFESRIIERPDIDSLQYDDPFDRQLFIRQHFDSFIPARDSFNRNTWQRNLNGKLVYVSSIKEIEWYLQTAAGLDTSFNNTDSLAVGFKKEKRYAGFYEAMTLNRLGWINCDRFLGVPQNANLIVRTHTKADAQRLKVFLVFPDINSIMPVNGGRATQTFIFRSLPDGYKARLVAFRTEGDQTWAYTSDVRIGEQKELMVDLKPIEEGALARMMK